MENSEIICTAPIMREPECVRILLIDDHKAFARLVQVFANKSGNTSFAVTAVPTLEDARAHLAERSFDLMLLDGHLQDGRSPAENAAFVSATFSGPIILFSGLIPNDFKTSPEYDRFAGAISKDDLSSQGFSQQLCSYVTEHAAC